MSRDDQLLREKAQRDSATGKRAKSVLRGDLGPVLRRWVSGSILPVAERLHQAAEAIIAGDTAGASGVLSSSLFGLATVTRSRDLETLLRWTLKDPSIANDMVLTVMGSTITTLASASKPVPLTRLLGTSASLARECAMGQFLTQVQGAKTMLKVRGSDGRAWAQRKQMDAVGAILAGQVRSALESRTPEELPLHGRSVVSILTPEGERRRIDLWPPEPDDWKLLELARRTKGEKDSHPTTWCSFAMLILCCAQAEAGWFDLTEMAPVEAKRRHGQHRRKAKGMVLSEGAYGAIKGDLDRWLGLGFIAEPMVVAPECGDYLSVKHREVAGGRGPMGTKTDAKGTAAWQVASDVMAGTPWCVAQGTLKAIRESEFVQSLVAKAEPDDVKREMLLASYRRVAAEPALYMPLFMDFRGRVYTRPHAVAYQGGDLQKGLLQFTAGNVDWRDASGMDRRIATHAANLYGHGLDKAPVNERVDWFRRTVRPVAKFGMTSGPGLGTLLWEADEPIQMLTLLNLVGTSAADAIPCQIDGTCNGLQHLSALFRDETAAPWVNLVEASDEEAPKDIYGEVARRTMDALGRDVQETGEGWSARVLRAVKIDRKLCKKAVMVLPYGGTRGTIEEAIQAGMLAQNLDSDPWANCLTTFLGAWVRDEGAVEAGYLAFANRELKDHPLLHKDAQRLAGIVWDVIVELLPKPMAAMQTFRDIAKHVGDRALEWSTGRVGTGIYGRSPADFEGVHTDCHSAKDLWVVQAKAKSERSTLQFKGLQLPGSVRGLSIRPGKDEVDAHAHVSGIVANFIHSQDASHLARTMARFDRRSFGAIHDCFITRPSLMGRLGVSTREAFESQYEADPLAQPVVVRRIEGNEADAYPSWYALAEACGVSFPDKGEWRPKEVTRSAWFFS